ncbi:PREDICTED: carbonic anhydrase-like [Branchiostoma belcheri]|uniref:Carbonic anhydrase n=1 Tax=Branchiostoma belcheri TaxID=7741 RepID=A0A6P4XHK6_BRABE|nr:PREDICTED: carbonic anhydrase-like [Branchiostoma belcheri]
MSLLQYCTLGALLIHLAYGAASKSRHMCLFLFAEWGYAPGQYGPENWKTLAPQFCSGSAQSPIDLVYRNTVKQTFPAFTFTGYNAVPGNVNFTMSNNGYAVGVSFDDNNAHRVGGGGLPGNNYKLAQFHFHWSFLDNLWAGSEHEVNGQIYPAELHLVHWNADQHTDLGDAVVGSRTNHASLAVLGFFIEFCNSDNPAFEPLLKYIANVSQSGTTFKYPMADRFSLDSLLPTDRTKFFRYNGSLTTPTCNEVVTWTVFKETISISRNQLTKFINSVYYEALPNTAATKMQGNYRPPQALNGRTVYRSFDDATLNVTPRPAPWDADNAAVRFVPELLFLLLTAVFAAMFY